MFTTFGLALIDSVNPQELGFITLVYNSSNIFIYTKSDDEYMFFGFDGDETGVGYIEPFEAAYEFK